MAILYVQNKHSAGVTSGNTVTSTFNSTTIAGNLLIAAIVMNSAADPITSITGGGTWAQAYVKTLTGGSIEVWYCPNCSAITDVVANFTASGEASIDTYEYSGIATSSPLDKTVTNSGNGSSASTGTTATISQANELIFASVGADNGSISDFGTINGNTAQNAWNIFVIGTSDAIVSSATTYSNTYTLNTTHNWAAGIATFKGVAASGPANVKTYNGVATASTKTINSIAIASVKTWDGIT